MSLIPEKPLHYWKQLKADGSFVYRGSTQIQVACYYNAVLVSDGQKRREMHFMDRTMNTANDDDDVGLNEQATQLLQQHDTVRVKGGKRVRVYGSAYLYLGYKMVSCIRTRENLDTIADALQSYLGGREHLLQSLWDGGRRVHDLYIADPRVEDTDMMALAMALA